MQKMIEIVFPFRLPGLNEYTAACRSSPHAGAKMKKEWQEKCEWIIRVSPSVRAARGKDPPPSSAHPRPENALVSFFGKKEKPPQSLRDSSPKGGAEIKKTVFSKPVILHFTFTEPNKKRDPDNISGFAHKVIFDALVAQGVLFGDGWKGVRGYTDEFRSVKGKSEIRVRIETE